MGRVAKFDRDAAVEICMNEMWRYGYEACSVKSISEKLGITRSSFYNAFGSREALFLEVVERYVDQLPHKSLRPASESTPIKRLLTDFFREVCHNITADPEARGCLGINSIAELVGNDESLGPVVEGALLRSVQRFEDILEAAVAKGEIEDDGQLHQKALSLQNLAAGLSLMSKVVRSKEDLIAVAEQTLKGMDLYEDVPAAMN